MNDNQENIFLVIATFHYHRQGKHVFCIVSYKNKLVKYHWHGKWGLRMFFARWGSILFIQKKIRTTDRCFYEIFAVATFEFWKMQSRQRTEQLFTVFARRNSDNHILQSDIKIIYIYRWIRDAINPIHKRSRRTAFRRGRKLSGKRETCTTFDELSCRLRIVWDWYRF